MVVYKGGRKFPRGVSQEGVPRDDIDMGDPIVSDPGDFGRARCGTGNVKPQLQAP